MKRSCTDCGAEFAPRHGTQQFCSPRCRYRTRDRRPEVRERDNRRHRERYDREAAAPTGFHNARATAAWYNVDYEAFEPRDVFERDGWVCGLCREEIDRGCEWPELRSASIDHILPWARGGGHTLANVQAAHLGCNLSKGALAAVA